MGIGQYHLAHRFTTQRFQINVLYWCRVSKGPQNALKKGQIGLKWIGGGAIRDSFGSNQIQAVSCYSH
jgi:hypothetical protein